jgi:hypothetical protein
MTYPTVGLLDESAVQIEGGFNPARATNGALRVRKLWPTDKRRFALVHMLTKAEFDSLQAYYDANALGQFNFTWPPTGQVHGCRFVAPPQPVTVGQHRRVTVTLEEA